MESIININTGEMAVGKNNTHLKTGSIGSCIVVTLYDRENKIGGMAHAMLPSRKKKNKNETDEVEKLAMERISGPESIAKYADEAIPGLIEEMVKLGAKKINIKAKLVGGSKMFRVLSGDEHGIGYKNTESAKETLKGLDVYIESEDTGGTVGRMVDFNIDNGILEVITRM